VRYREAFVAVFDEAIPTTKITGGGGEKIHMLNGPFDQAVKKESLIYGGVVFVVGDQHMFCREIGVGHFEGAIGVTR
jgi:hypothetical protein